MKDENTFDSRALKLALSKRMSLEEQYTFYHVKGQKIYELASQINNEIIDIHDTAFRMVFSDVDERIVYKSPSFLRDAGHSMESSMTKSEFEQFVKLNQNYLTNKILYYHDLEALINSVQNRYVIITTLIDELYLKLSPNVMEARISSFDNVILTRDVAIYSMLHTIIINVVSCCDILTKLTTELISFEKIDFKVYSKMASKDVLFSKSKYFPTSLKSSDSLFAADKPIVLKKIESLRNEIIHNGTLDFDYYVYYGFDKGNTCLNWIYYPDFDANGNLSTYCNRKKFYSDCRKTFNTELPVLLIDFLSISVNTLRLLNKEFRFDKYESVLDFEKYQNEILNWDRSISKM